MADVFEERLDLDEPRRRLWELIENTPCLDWLLLTKRPHAVLRAVSWGAEWPDNVWVGATVENQRMATKRLPILLAIPAKRRFISCEPLFGPIDLMRFSPTGKLHWVITGGESGGSARPSHPNWFRTLRDQCRAAGIAFHFKQWGNWAPREAHPALCNRPLRRVGMNGTAVDMIRLNKGEAGRTLDNEQWDEVPQSVAVA